MDVEEVITLDSDDDDQSTPDLVVGPTGTAVPVTPTKRLPSASFYTPGEPEIASRGRPPVNSGYPKKPGPIPPFTLFSEDHREKVVEQYPSLNFNEVCAKLSEMWHAMVENDKELYRSRAKKLTDRKMKEWINKVQMHNAKQQALVQAKPKAMLSQTNPLINTSPQAKVKATGFGVFGSDVRKTMAVGTSKADMVKTITDAWKTASRETRRLYECRATRINDLAIQRARQRLSLGSQMPQVQSRQSQPGNSGPRMASVSSLSKQSNLRPDVSLPNGITITRVEPEISIVSEQMATGIGRQMNIPPGLTIQRTREPLPFNRRMDPRLPRPAQPGRRLLQKPSFQVTQRAQPLLHRSSPIQSFPQLNQMNGNQSLSSLKRGLPPNFGGHLPQAKMPRMQLMPAARGRPAQPMNTNAVVCRLCFEKSSYSYRLLEKPKVISACQEVLGFELDMAENTAKKLPDAVCRKCCTLVTTFADFKEKITAAQNTMKSMTPVFPNSRTMSPIVNPGPSFSQGMPMLPLPPELMAPSLVDSNEDSILPDYDNDVTITAITSDEPKPVSIKQEKMSFKQDLEKMKADNERLQSSETKQSQDKNDQSEIDSQSREDGITEQGPADEDPLSFIQLGSIEGNYQGFGESESHNNGDIAENNNTENEFADCEQAENEFADSEQVENEFADSEQVENEFADCEQVENDIAETGRDKNDIADIESDKNDIAENDRYDNEISETEKDENQTKVIEEPDSANQNGSISAHDNDENLNGHKDACSLDETSQQGLSSRPNSLSPGSCQAMESENHDSDVLEGNLNPLDDFAFSDEKAKNGSNGLLEDVIADNEEAHLKPGQENDDVEQVFIGLDE